MTIHRAALLCQQLYAGPAGFDLIYQGEESCNIYIGIVDDGTDMYVVLRGSDTWMDYIRDARFLLVDRKVGQVDQGFFQGIPKAFKDLMPTLSGRRVFFIGHSLGGAHAYLLACEMVKHYFAVAGIFTFGSPRPGGQDVHDCLQAAEIPIWAVENEDDIIPELPFTLPGFPYMPAFVSTQLIKIDARPTLADDLWGPVASHHIELYVEGTEGLKV